MNNNNQESGKLAPKNLIGEGITFKNDFGENPVGLAHITQDQGVIAIISLAGAFVGAAVGGWLFPAAILLAALNDLRYLGKSKKPQSNDTVDNPKTVDVPVRTIDDFPQQTEQNTLRLTESSNLTAYSRILDCMFESRAFIGAQRTGKTYLAAVASYSLHLKGIKIYHINLGSYGDEDNQYWGHAESVRGDLSALSANQAEHLIDRAIKLVEKFYAQSRAILVVDEWAYVGSTTNAFIERLEPLMKLLADKISTLSSTGMKRGKAIWAIAPEFVASNLTNDAKSMKKLKLCYVTIAPGRYVYWEDNAIGFSGELYDQVKNNFPINPPKNIEYSEDRICFIDGQWISLGELPQLPQLHPIKVIQDKAPKEETKADKVNANELNVSDVLANNMAEPLKTIWLFAKDRDDWVTVRDIQRKDFAVLDKKGSKQIRQLLGLLADTGYGEIDESGNSDSSVRFKAN